MKKIFFLLLMLSPLTFNKSQINSQENREEIANQSVKQITTDETVGTVSQSSETYMKYINVKEKNKMYLSIIVSCSTVIILILVLRYLSISNLATPSNIINGSALVLIIQAVILVGIAAQTSEQLTASIGVMAAIAGYLFGSATKRNEDRNKKIKRKQT